MRASTAARVLGAGSLAFAAWGLLRPSGLAAVMGVSQSDARQIGMREAAIGASLVVRPGPGALVCRAIADLSDAVRSWRHDRRVSAASAAFGLAALGLAAPAAWSRVRRGSTQPTEEG